MDVKPRNLARKSLSAASRCRLSALYVLMSPYCRLCLYTGLIFGTGLIVGVLLDEYLLSGLLLTAANHHLPLGFQEIRSAKRGGSDGSAKKDLKFPFKDYMPKRVFINCAWGPPDSLDLFMETYPDSHKYVLHTFLVDPSYKPLYARFQNSSLYSSTVMSSHNNTSLVSLPDVKRPDRNVSAPVIELNFSDWVKGSVHQDDYVVVRLCDDAHLLQILGSLYTEGTWDWVDRVYISTTKRPTARHMAELQKHAGDSAAELKNKIYMWDDGMVTYGDFETINQPANVGEETQAITQCHDQEGNETEFALLLYMSSLNQHSYYALNLLHAISKKHPFQLPLTLFLPVQYVEFYENCASLSSLGSKMELGLYFSDSFRFSTSQSIGDDMKENNMLRNKLVQAEHCFSYSELKLNYVLPEYVVSQSLNPTQKKETLSSKIRKGTHTSERKKGTHSSGRTKGTHSSEGSQVLKEVIYERGYTVMAKVKDATYFIHKPDADFRHIAENTGNGLVAIDISVQGSDTLLLKMLNAHISSLIPTHICKIRGRM